MNKRTKKKYFLFFKTTHGDDRYQHRMHEMNAIIKFFFLVSQPFEFGL
mgnify:CR=1